MIKLTIKLTGEENIKKEADKAVEAELRKLRKKAAENADIPEINSDIPEINSDLEVVSRPPVSTTPKISSAPTISSGVPSRKKQ